MASPRLDESETGRVERRVVSDGWQEFDGTSIRRTECRYEALEEGWFVKGTELLREAIVGEGNHFITGFHASCFPRSQSQTQPLIDAFVSPVLAHTKV